MLNKVIMILITVTVVVLIMVTLVMVFALIFPIWPSWMPGNT